MYAKLQKVLEKFISKKNIFKYGFNFSPMYSRTTGRICEISDDLHKIKIRIKLSYKNSNYVGSIFGGSMLSATDPIFMIQLFNILGNNYVVWDKAASIKFKRPARETCYAVFTFTTDEIIEIKKEVASKNEIDLIKNIKLTNKDESIVFAEVSKTIYVADKQFYKKKLIAKKKIVST